MKNDYFTKETTGGRPRFILNDKGKSVDTLTNKNNKPTFTEYKIKGQSKGKVSLRRYQFKLAEKSAPMAIFLGKNYLGQKDNIEFVDNSEVNAGINNIVNLLNKPVKVRTEKDIEKSGD